MKATAAAAFSSNDIEGYAGQDIPPSGEEPSEGLPF